MTGNNQRKSFWVHRHADTFSNTYLIECFGAFFIKIKLKCKNNLESYFLSDMGLYAPRRRIFTLLITIIFSKHSDSNTLDCHRFNQIHVNYR